MFVTACSASLKEYTVTLNERENPLPECPDSPNCVRIATEFNADTAQVKAALLSALEKMSAHEVLDKSNEQAIDAVFRIAVFGFKDDVNLVYEATEDSTIVYIRSASREGYSDLGVNSRRVKKLIKNTRELLTD